MKATGAKRAKWDTEKEENESRKERKPKKDGGRGEKEKRVRRVRGKEGESRGLRDFLNHSFADSKTSKTLVRV